MNHALRNTAFHARTAPLVAPDAWVARDGFLVPARYADPSQEALSARTSAALIDFSFVERLRVHGKGAARMLSAAFGTDVTRLATGESCEVHWRSEAGGVRGLGTLVRAGETNYLLLAYMVDAAWFQRAATRFGVTVRDETMERGMLLVAGPYAFAVLAAAGLESAARLPANRHATYDISGVYVTVGRWDPLAGFTIMMATPHAPALFDRVARAGELFGMTMAGQEALETLLLEAGVPLPGIDFTPARDDDAAAPARQLLYPPPPPPPPPPPVEEPKVSENGQVEVMAPPPSAPKETPPAPPAVEGLVLAGVEIDSDTPAPFAPILIGGTLVGHTLRSAWSPALRRAIALAHLPANYAAPDTRVVVLTPTITGPVDTAARVCALPFL